MISMGLEVLTDNAHDSSSKGVVMDLTDACNTAVGILNDLLLYDKIEEGEVRLEKQVVVARSFLMKCIQMFVVPVRSCSCRSCPCRCFVSYYDIVTW